MFVFLKKLKYNKKDLNFLSNKIENEKDNKILNEIFLNKIYEKYNDLKTSFENNDIFEYAKHLKIFYNKESNINIYKNFIELNKNSIENFIETNFEKLDKNKNSLRFDFLNFSVLNHFFKDSPVTIKLYNSFVSNIIEDQDSSNINKIKELVKLFDLISSRIIIKELFTKKLIKILEKTKEDILNDKINISKDDIDMFKEFNKWIYIDSYNSNYIIVSKIEIIDFYNKINFLNINKEEYISLISNKNISKELFDKIINNLEVNSNNIEKVYNVLKNSNYKNDYKDLFNNLEKNMQTIKSNRNKNILITSLLLGTIASSSNNENNSNLLNNVLSVGVDVGIGYGISELLEEI